MWHRKVRLLDKEHLIELLKELFEDGKIEIFPSRHGIKVIIDGEIVQEN